MKQNIEINIENNNLKKLVIEVLQRIPDKLPFISVFTCKYDVKDDTGGEVNEENNILLDIKILEKGKDYAVGVIAHEFAHTHLMHGYLGRDFASKNRGTQFSEMDADLLACKWGFKKEIKIVRKNVIRWYKKSWEKLEKSTKNSSLSLKPEYKKKQDNWFKLAK